VWFRVLVGIPLGTALAEEIVFRGVLLAAFDRLTTSRRAVVATSLLFGLWHVGAEVARTGAMSVGIVPGGLATTAASAVVLCPLRRWTGDLAAPVAVHTVINAGVLVAVIVLRR
jgi:membrane protease YdiL (CAAX protease family)